MAKNRGKQENVRRANRAKHSLQLYSQNDLKTSIVDILTDLHHLCDANRIDMNVILQLAKKHHHAEITGTF